MPVDDFADLVACGRRHVRRGQHQVEHDPFEFLHRRLPGAGNHHLKTLGRKNLGSHALGVGAVIGEEDSGHSGLPNGRSRADLTTPAQECQAQGRARAVEDREGFRSSRIRRWLPPWPVGLQAHLHGGQPIHHVIIVPRPLDQRAASIRLIYSPQEAEGVVEVALGLSGRVGDLGDPPIPGGVVLDRVGVRGRGPSGRMT